MATPGPVPVDDTFVRMLLTGEFAVTAEVTPPISANPEDLLTKALPLKDHVDAVNVFEHAILQPDVKFEIVYGVSDSTWPLYDVDHGRRVIGYHPQEKSDIDPGDVTP